MSWTSVKDLKAQLFRQWARGDLLREALSTDTRFPLRLTLKPPASADITEHFETVRVWASEFVDAHPLRIEWQAVRHRVQGLQHLPASAWIDSLDDALIWLGKRPEWNRFSALVETTRIARPALLTWLEKRPLQALELAGDWPRLLAVVGWMVEHPCPAIYLRQVDLPGVHSKFIEAHRAVLIELLDLALPPHAVDVSKTGVSQFAARYGFRDKPTRIRFRVLDPRMQIIPGPVCPDITLDAESFRQCSMGVTRVFITENETNFLAFPNTADAIAIFGAGYGWDALARSRWLEDCEMYYWGDIDTHGFAILNQLRERFTHVTSFLMDRATLDAHADFWGIEEKPIRTELPSLTREERALYDDLRDNRIRAGIRLEQEHIGFNWLNERLQTI